MLFCETAITGAFVIEPERVEDERGFFVRTWCRREFAARGLMTDLAQCGLSFSPRKGTLRGLHYQEGPHSEAKLVRCTRGSIYDVIVDLRPHSPSFGRWLAYELTAESRHALYVPEGCAHGFQTLETNTEVCYQMSEFYAPDAARGVRWNDPRLAIAWPIPDPIVSPRDASYPDFPHHA